MRTIQFPPPLLLGSTAPWTLQSPVDLLACLQCPRHPFVSQNQPATKSSPIPLSRLAPSTLLFFQLQRLIAAWEARLSPVLDPLCPDPEARCQHSAQPTASAYTTQLRWEGVSLPPSSKIVKCFLLDQRRSKLVNHTTNAAVARHLPRTAARTLPANRRCNLLVQAEPSIIPDINRQAWTKRLLQPSAGVSGAENPQQTWCPKSTFAGSVLAGPGWSLQQLPVDAQRGLDTSCCSNTGRKHGNTAARGDQAYAVLGDFPEWCLQSLPLFPSYLDFWLCWEQRQPGCPPGQLLWAAVPPVSPGTAAAAQAPWPRTSQGTNSRRVCTPLWPKPLSSLSPCLLLKLHGLEEFVLVKLYKTFCYFSSVFVNTEIKWCEGQEILLVYVFGVGLDVQSGREGT